MPDAQDLNQIEYRHHPTRDLWPVASSMSAQSRSSLHAQIRAWVRHPHDERLSESACYQLLANGNAALAWRYWDERAAERADRTRGRPLVTRVLAGAASILSPKVAVALSRNGPTADLIGVLPGEVPDGAEMPTVSGSAVAALAAEMAPELDEAAMWENGLQAVVAAALCNPSTPLAVSLEDSLMARPLGQCVQCTLLWGLLRVTGPILGPVGRGWSFSTFELPLGDTDTAALPGIVFRQAQDTQPAGINWRKELKVRPLAPDALSAAAPYADWLELAGWLVAEYRDRRGDGLAALLADLCGNKHSLQGRLEQLQARLGYEHSAVITSQGSAYVAQHAGFPAPAPPPSGLPRPGPEPPEAVEVQPDQTAVLPQLGADWVPPPPAASDLVSRRAVDVDPGDWDSHGGGGSSARSEWPGPETGAGSGQQVPASYSPRSWTMDEVAPPRDGRDAPDLSFGDRAGGQPHEQAQQSYPPQSYVQQQQPPYPQGQPYAQPVQPSYQHLTVSSLLRQLELAGSDPGRFRSCLEAIFRLRDVDDPADQMKSWELISGRHWFRNVSRCEVFRLPDLAMIFSIVLIPELRRGGVREEAIANWALDVPSEMIWGLLAAVTEADDQRPLVHAILEPVLAARWARDNSMEDLWDKNWPETAAEADRRDDKSRLRGFISLSRKRR
jgi:hypothetical protein